MDTENIQVDQNCEMVEEQFGCPNCHNRNMDELVWLDDETVKCTCCNTEYEL